MSHDAEAQRQRDALYALRKQVYQYAHGRWPELLARSQVDERYLRLRKQGPCPLCKDGTDRYSFDDRQGDGDFICRQCGSGKGVTFLMKYHSWSWTDAVDWVLQQLGLGTESARLLTAPPPAIPARQHLLDTEELAKRRRRFQQVWEGAKRVVAGDPVHRYLRTRVPGLSEVPYVLRYHPGLEYFWDQGDKKGYKLLGRYPAMVAAVMDRDGNVCNIHRTFLTGDGEKATIVSPDGEILAVKKQMPSLGVKGFAIRLASGEPRDLGVAEGIETSLAARLFAGIPTWSVVSTSGMRSFPVPEFVERLTIFADHDMPDSTGQKPGFAAAHALAKREDIVARVKARTLRVSVRTPARAGTDIADLLMRIAKAA